MHSILHACWNWNLSQFANKADTIKSKRKVIQQSSLNQILKKYISYTQIEKNMTTNFCYRCAVDTELILTGKKPVCSKCGLSESQAKKYVNTEKKTNDKR